MRYPSRKSRRPTSKIDRHQHFPVLIQPDETGGFWAACPSLQGCYSQGETIEEALTNVREAIELCLEDAPKNTSSVEDVSLHFVRV